jgi:two-component system, OmpR family, response regulator
VSVSRVGICEDDDGLRSVLVRALRAEGYEVQVATSGREAVRVFAARAPDLLVLDIGLPDSDGRDVCQALRAHGMEAPVIFLTARETLTDRLSGFHAGADDYLTKPFAIAELLVRIEALLRRSSRGAPAPPDSAFPLDPSTHAVHMGDRHEPLTPTEFRLLAALAAKPGTTVRRRELVLSAWPPGAIVNENTLDTYISRLRRKLRAIGSDQAIDTAWGVGYVLR